MLSSSSGSEEITNSGSTNYTKTRSDQSSSSSKSSLSSTPRTMEEVWKDINLSSLHDNIMITSSDHHQPNPISPPPPPRPPPPPPNFPPNNLHRPNNFQDFLARPLSKTNDLNLPKSLVGSLSSSMASPSPSPSLHHHHPATALSLNSGPEFRFLDNALNHHHNHNHHNHHHDLLITRPHSITNPTSMIISISNNSNSNSNNNNPFDSSAASFGKRRFPCDNNIGGGGGSGDRRHKRMIKNRESAARSRARKQAYTNELEIEVAHLLEENERLRKQQEQLFQAAAAQLPKKHSLQRTSTAPF